ncbi:MAG: thioredoxin [Akkermansia sp.]
MALTLTEDNFTAEVLQSDKPVLVDFWATWCGPCRMIAPIIDQLATEFEGRVKIGKVDVDTNNGIASTYNVRSIPTLIFFKGGQMVDTIVGASSKEAISQKLQALL